MFTKRNRMPESTAFSSQMRCSFLRMISALTTTEHALNGEQRWITLGVDALGRILVVVYTRRKSRVRIISARPATPGERYRYAEGL